MNISNSLKVAARKAGAVWNPASRQWQFKNAGGDHWVTLHGKYNVDESGDKSYRRVLLDKDGKIVGGDMPKSAQGKSVSSWWKTDEVQDLSSQEREDFVSYAQRMKGKHLKPEDILSQLDALKGSSPDAHKRAVDAFREDYSKNQGTYQKEREEQSRTYLTVPYSEKESAKKAGAKWDKDKGSWYFPGKDNIPSELSQWKPGTTEAKEKQEQKATERVYLDVPYDEKDKARRAGARWDSGKRQWYFPSADDVPSKAKEWLPKADYAPKSESPSQDISGDMDKIMERASGFMSEREPGTFKIIPQKVGAWTADESKLPKLKGSEKQIKWAESIRLDRIERVRFLMGGKYERIEDIKKKITRPDLADRKESYGKRLSKQYEDLRQLNDALKLFETSDSAKDIIDQRHYDGGSLAPSSVW